jgi:hypothetical protein
MNAADEPIDGNAKFPASPIRIPDRPRQPNPPPSNQGLEVNVAFQGLRHWGPRFEQFLKEHSSWPLLQVQEPVYALPKEAIKELVRTNGKRKSLIDKDSESAERAFLDLCQNMSAIGAWSGRPIHYSLFNRPSKESAIALFPFTGWSEKEQNDALKLIEKADKRFPRTKGVVGWLLTEPQFVSELAAVRSDWEELSAKQRPEFPLRRLAAVRSGGERLFEFGRKLFEFLNRWGLIGLVTWDLPEPQGPLLPSPLAPDALASPRHGILLYLPLHYPLRGDDELLEQIRAIQQQNARELHIPESLAGLPHHVAYGKMFDILFLERAVRSRFGGTAPKGLADAIENAAVETTALAREQVHRYRKTIARCLKGKRDKIKWLRTKKR